MRWGAGKGLLSHHLQKKGIQIRATDDDSWKLIKENNYNVEIIDYKTAIKKYKPKTVIVSWMLLGVDWTPFFREMNVKEYIIIGEGWGGCTGSESVFDSHVILKQKFLKTLLIFVVQTIILNHQDFVHTHSLLHLNRNFKYYFKLYN